MKRRRQILFALAALLLTGCRPDMFYQPKGDPLKESAFFEDGGVSQPLVSNTIPTQELHLQSDYYTGLVGTNLITTFPYPITAEVLQRGRQRFEINCSPCHGRTGQGNGMVVQRGFPAPPSYHIQRLRDAPVGHFVDVMARGYGIMYSYAQRVEPDDRWAIAAYIRVLQLSEHATLQDVPPEMRAQLETTNQPISTP